MADLIQFQPVITGLAGSPYLSTFNFNAVDIDPATIAANVRQFFIGLQTQMSSAATVNFPTEMKLINEVSGEIQDFLPVPVTAAVQGGVSGEVLPTANQALLRLKTGSVRDGRRVAGHLYIPGICEVSAVNGLLAGPSITTITNVANTLLTAQLLKDSWAIWSRPREDRVGLAPKIASCSVWNQFAVLRSRRT